MSAPPDGVVRLAVDVPRVESTQFTTVLTAPGSVTGGDLGVFDCRLGPDSPGASAHYHEGFSESFFVLSGRLAVRTGDDWTTLGPGDLAHVPRRGVHAFHPDGGEVRFLMMFTPGAPRERYFTDLAELVSRAVPPGVEEIDEVARRHDQINLR